MLQIFFLISLLSTIAVSQSNTQNISAVLTDQGISNFTFLLQSVPSVYAQIEQGGVTVLVPTDEAFSKQFGTSLPNSTSEIEALLRYHILQGIKPSNLLSGSAKFLPTLLENSTFSNVTGGQVVEAVGVNGNAVFYSGLQQASNLVKADVFYDHEGLAQIVDAVLSPPAIVPATITHANLTGLVGLANEANLLGAQALAVGNLFNTASDLTFFAPNSSLLAQNAAGFASLTPEARKDLAFYHLVQGPVLYSSMLKDGATFTTLDGKNITITVTNGSTYVNSAKIIMKDLLTFNGVMQVIDSPLNPNDTNTRPNITSHSASSTPSKSSNSNLSTPVKIGVIIGAAVGGLVAASLVYFIIRRRGSPRYSPDRSRNQSQTSDMHKDLLIPHSRTPSEMSTDRRTLYLSEAGSREIMEMESRRPSIELNAGPGSEIGVGGGIWPVQLPPYTAYAGYSQVPAGNKT